MAANLHQPHLLVLPEDDANRQILNGFRNRLDVNPRQMQILHPAGGWLNTMDVFLADHLAGMRKYGNRYFLIVIDCDNKLNRLEDLRIRIPVDLIGRAYILGSSDEPEKLKGALNSKFEQIGESLAADCADGTDLTWGHPMLKHNKTELDRLRMDVAPFLFPR